MLAMEGLSRARPEWGRFRTFLLTSLRNFVSNEWQRERAAKRGSGVAPLSLEFENAGERFSREPADPGLTPQQAFDRSYALDMISHAVESLRNDYEKSGRGEIFATLRPLLWGNASPGAIAQKAAVLA
jgi:hypothetical protein